MVKVQERIEGSGTALSLAGDCCTICMNACMRTQLLWQPHSMPSAPSASTNDLKVILLHLHG
jgi:hypothetical protein